MHLFMRNCAPARARFFTSTHPQVAAMFAPPAPMMRQYCERDETGTGPVLDQDEGEEVSLVCSWLKWERLVVEPHI